MVYWVAMYVERVPNRNSPPTVLLRESYRDRGHVKKRTLANLSKLPAAGIEALRRVLRGDRLVTPDETFTCVRSLPHGHVAAVLGAVRQLGLHTVIARQASRVRDLIVALVVARIIDAQSKLATARALAPESAVSTLGELLELGDVDQHELYAAMDWLVGRQAAVEQRLARRHLEDHTLVLYDLTSSYVEGTHCPLAQRGHSRDGKQGTLQVVFGLLCTAAGCPVAVEVFEGSTADPMTVRAQVEKIRTRFGLQRVVLVGDRGMLTAARIREDLEGVEGLRWITTLRAPTIRKLVAARTVTPSLFDERDLAEITSAEFPGERLIVCRNPLLAAERQRKRTELLEATNKDLEPIAAATRRTRNPLRGAAAIGVRVGKVINRHKVAKHFSTAITDTTFTFRRDDEKIAAEAHLDGLYIVRSNVEPERFDAQQTVRAYKDLSKVERRLPEPQDGGPQGPAAPPPAGGPRAGAHPALYAGLLRRVAHAPTAGAATLRRPRPGGRRAQAPLGRGSGTALAGRPRQSPPQADPRRLAGPQFPDAAHRPRHADRQHDAGYRRRCHLPVADAADGAAAALLRTAGGVAPIVARTEHLQASATLSTTVTYTKSTPKLRTNRNVKVEHHRGNSPAHRLPASPQEPLQEFVWAASASG